MKFTTFLLASTAIIGTSAAFIVTRKNDVSRQNNNMSGGSTSSLKMNAGGDNPAAYILSEVGSHDVVVFSKSYCPFCTSTKSLFEKLPGVEARVIELDQRDDGDAIQSALLDKTGQRTVPSVFIKGEHIGGNDDTQKSFKSGELTKKLGIELEGSW